MARPLKDFHILVLKPFQCYFGCMLGVIVLLECKSSLQFKVFYTLKQVLLKDLLYLASFIVPSILTSLPVPATENHSPSYDAATIILRGTDGVGWVMSRVRFPPDVALCIQAKEFNFRFIRPHNRLLHALNLSRTFCKVLVCCHVPFSQEWLLSGRSHIKPTFVKCCRDCCPFLQVLPSQPRN